MKKATSSGLTKRQRDELAALRVLPDHLIDTSNAPEVQDWSAARRGAFYLPEKQR
jgi:hypothetical protein